MDNPVMKSWRIGPLVYARIGSVVSLGLCAWRWELPIYRRLGDQWRIF